MIDHQNMDGEERRTKEHQQIAVGNCQRTVDTQQIQGDHRQSHADPNRQRHLFLEKQTENRDQHDIQSGNKTRLACIGAGAETGLLQVCADSQRRTAAKAADPQLLAALLLLLRGKELLYL